MPRWSLTFHRSAAGFAKNEQAVVVKRDEKLLVVRSANGKERTLEPRRFGGFDVGLGKELPVAKGDRLLIRANCKAEKLNNGDVVAVESFASDGAIALSDGRRVPANFRQFSHGYATTSHSSQGKTVARGLLLLADTGLRAANLKQAYVSNSRFQESQMIYTTDKRAARDAMQRPAARRLALEVFVRSAPACASFRQMLLHRINQVGLANPAMAALRGCWDTFTTLTARIRPGQH